MAQIIKHRRGTLAELNGVTLNNGELGIVTSSVANIGDAILKTAVVVGNTDGTNRLSIGRIITGNATPNLSGITGGAAFNNMLYHETDAKTLLVLNTGGNTNLDLTGNIAGREIGGNISGSSTSTGSFGYLNVVGDGVIGGNLTFGDANTDNVSFGADVSSSLIPNNDDAFDLGSSGQQWKDLYVDGVAYIDTIGSDGDPTTSAYIAGGEIDATVIGSETPAAITGTTIDATTDFTIGTTVITDDSIVMTPTTDDTATIAATTNGALAITTVDTAAAAANITITADGTVDIDSAGLMTLDSGAAINIEPAGGSAILLDGTISIDGGVVTGASSITSTNFVGIIDGALGSVTPATIVGTTITANTSILPDAAGGADIGSTSAEWGDVFIADDKKIKFGSDQDATIEYDEDGTNELRFAGAAATFEQAVTFDGDMSLGLTTDDTISVLGNSTFSGTTIANLGTVSAATSITSTAFVGPIDGIVGGNTPAAGTFTSLVASADVDLGNATSDTITATGRFDSDLVPSSDSARDLGTSALYWKDAYIDSVTTTGNLEVGGNTTITGNLTVNGTTTAISSSVLDIGDNIIQVNGTPVTYGGIQVKDVTAGQTGSMVWNSTSDYWVAGLSGSEYRVPLQNTTTALTDNRVVLSQGNGRIESSANITDDGSTVDFNDVDLTSLDKLEGVDANTYIDLGGSTLIVTKGTLQPSAHNGNDLGATGTRYKDLWLQGNADLEGDIDVNGTANLDNTDIDGTLDVQGVADFQARVDAQASLAVTGSVYVSAGASVTAASASLVSFRNDSTTQLGYLASADTQAVTTGLVGYNTSNGNLTISSVIDGGSF